MLQNVILKRNIINKYFLNNITLQSIYILNRRDYTKLNNKLFLNLNRSENLLNSYSKYNLYNFDNIILKRFISGTDVEKSDKNISNDNKTEEQEKINKNIKKEQRPKNNKKNKNKKKQKKNWQKITFVILGGIGIGYSINYLLNNNNDLLESFKNKTFRKKMIDKFDVPDFHELVTKEEPHNKDTENDITVDVKIKENIPSEEANISKTNFDLKKDINNAFIETDESAKDLKKEITVNQNGQNSFLKNVNDTINYFSSFFSFGHKSSKSKSDFDSKSELESETKPESESISEFDKEVEDAYFDIMNNISKIPSDVKLNNLNNNESININSENINNKESLKEIKEKLKNWGDKTASGKLENLVKPKELMKSERSEIIVNKEDISINGNNDPNEDNIKIEDLINDAVENTDNTETNKKIIKISAKPIVKAFHEASKISSTLEKNKNNLPEFLAGCIKDSTNAIKNISNNNTDIQNTFLDIVKIFSDSMNTISDYLDQLEIEIKTELNDNIDQDEKK